MLLGSAAAFYHGTGTEAQVGNGVGAQATHTGTKTQTQGNHGETTADMSAQHMKYDTHAGDTLDHNDYEQKDLLGSGYFHVPPV